MRKKFASIDESLQKLDGKLQRGLNNSFAFVLGGKIVASEVEQTLRDEMAENKVATFEGYTEAPNTFTVAVSSKDFRNLSEKHPGLPETTAEVLTRMARNNGWVCSGAVVVTIVEDPDRRTGQLDCTCGSDPEATGASCYTDANGNTTGAGTDGVAGAGYQQPVQPAPHQPQQPQPHQKPRQDQPARPDQPDQQAQPAGPGQKARPARPARPAAAGYPAAPAAGADGATTYRGGRLYGQQSADGAPAAGTPANGQLNPPTAQPGPKARWGEAGAGGFTAPAAPVNPYDGEPVMHAPTVTLLLQDGSSRTYLVMEGSNIIGRGTDADFRLPDTGVSRRHAEITWDGRDAVLVDLNSTNGTTVNDMPVDNWLLADGDVITVGHSYIEVRITGSTGSW